jgi:mannose-6-phosphate isomerase
MTQTGLNVRSVSDGTRLEPLVFVPRVLEKVWGGRGLARFGKELAKPDGAYGESWEVADMGATSASGAGGGAIQSVVASGALAGKTIGEAIAAWGDGLIDRSLLNERGEFPLLVKLLDARKHLSVQVHPSPAYARAHAGAHLKTECWYVLHVEPRAELFIGLKPGVTRERFAALVRDGSAEIAEALVRRPAIVGELHNLPSGVVHALGAGVIVAEVQTPSDTTYRVYDWGRAGREMHVEQAIEAAVMEAAPAPTRRTENEDEVVLVRTEYFVVREARLSGASHGLTREDARAPVMVMGVGGVARLAWRDEEMEVEAGKTVLVSRGLVEDVRLEGAGARVLLVEPRRA